MIIQTPWDAKKENRRRLSFEVELNSRVGLCRLHELQTSDTGSQKFNRSLAQTEDLDIPKPSLVILHRLGTFEPDDRVHCRPREICDRSPNQHLSALSSHNH